MAVLSNTINPGISNLRHIEAQGANVGDYAWGADGNYYRWNGERWEMEQGASSGGGGGEAPPPFQFDWAATEAAELEKLRPYYEKILAEEGGDVDRALVRLEQDYQTGVRRSQEDLARTQRITSEDLTTQRQQLGLEEKEETRETLADLNRRGVLFGQIPTEGLAQAPYSSYAQEYALGPMDEKQRLRRLAVERALERQGEVAGVSAAREQENLALQRGRGTEDVQTAFERRKQALEQEKREKATLQMTPLRYEQEYQKYLATLPKY